MARLVRLSRIRLALHFEVGVLVVILLLDVLRDDFVGDVAARHAEVPTRPHVPAPELLPQVRELVHQFVRTLPFQHLEQPADGHLRRDRNEQVHVILRDVPLHNRDLVVAAYLADQLPEPQPNFTRHHRLAVLGDPDDVQVNLEDRVRAAPVIPHGRESSTTGAALHTC